MNYDAREWFWVGLGLLGQLLFTGRFVVQWIASEKAKKSIVTKSFWVFGILGSTILSVYAVYRKDPVYIIGQAPGIFIYTRNLMLMKKEEKANASLQQDE
ncbi:lipid-A-disaccharide synthase N-terminal domain-containing protein [Cohnella thailandensis]|uniref:Lipid-A-disaccharide synthase N-terminal domain-containing protein n=1 Tax=Cohnella thailandensis TaxID=557557 RepID=A0A841SWV0_9BACL|nr:lipid-A-disaccharide synthase N-terminal domain-containing protein [Cohnella thailandensis]MBB6634605.1 lipid-A-disaccharide synthase N-terminal domain-containing protein [Cohnella thailandensis]MBP1972839.1 lipid-A-disaccharide synthase-like uncharacterized protein [Cohnella thailandensis]